MVVATTMAGWAWRKPSQGTAGITSSEWGLPCLLHTPPLWTLLPVSAILSSSPPPFSSPQMSFNETPHGFVAFSLPLCFSFAILLSDLRNSMCFVPIDWGYKESGRLLVALLQNRSFHCERIYAVMMEFIPSSRFSLNAGDEARRPWFFIQGTSVMNGNICPRLDLNGTRVEK